MQAIISTSSLIRLEVVVCDALNWELIVPTAMDFTHVLCDCIEDLEAARRVRRHATGELYDYYFGKLNLFLKKLMFNFVILIYFPLFVLHVQA